MENEDDDQPETPAGPRQTLNYLRRLLERHGLEARSKLGQNFLIDLNLLDLILRVSQLSPRDLVIEVGSGTGSLTSRLADQAGAVLSVEVDAAFHSLAREVVPERPGVVLLHADILKNKNQLNPEVLAALDELRRQHPDYHLKLVANLPYVVATPVIANFLCSELPLERLVVTVQWEIAERLLAHPGTKDYGALSVLVQSLAKVELIRKLSPKVFWPRPKVESAIVRIFPQSAKRSAIPNVLRFRNFLRDLYTQRRKNLRAALAGLPSGRRSREEVDRKLAELGLDGKSRAEELTVQQHQRLCEAFTFGE